MGCICICITLADLLLQSVRHPYLSLVACFPRLSRRPIVVRPDYPVPFLSPSSRCTIPMWSGFVDPGKIVPLSSMRIFDFDGLAWIPSTTPSSLFPSVPLFVLPVPPSLPFDYSGPVRLPWDVEWSSLGESVGVDALGLIKQGIHIRFARFACSTLCMHCLRSSPVHRTESFRLPGIQCGCHAVPCLCRSSNRVSRRDAIFLTSRSNLGSDILHDRAGRTLCALAVRPLHPRGDPDPGVSSTRLDSTLTSLVTLWCPCHCEVVLRFHVLASRIVSVRAEKSVDTSSKLSKASSTWHSDDGDA